MEMLGREGRQTLLHLSTSALDGSMFRLEPESAHAGQRLGLESQEVLRAWRIRALGHKAVLNMYTRAFFPVLHRPWATFSPPSLGTPQLQYSQPTWEGSSTQAGSLECHGRGILTHMHQLPQHSAPVAKEDLVLKASKDPGKASQGKQERLV